MLKLTKYILKNFTESFNPIFFSLFFMVSIIYFIKIAKITSYIKITFLELGKLYVFVLPRIIVYTFPIVFFIAIAVSLGKMSKDNELSVLFSFGLSPKKVASIFFIFSFLTTIFLLVNSLFLVPISKQLYSNFVDIKKAEAKLNIKAMEFGQKFANWLVFINKSTGHNSFEDIVMYKKEKTKEDFIIAKKANINNKSAILNLTLQNGKAFDIKKDQIKQTNYKKLILYNKKDLEKTSIKGIFDYWLQARQDEGRAKDLALFILVSLFPVSAFLLAVSFGIFNPRYEKGNIYISIFITVLSYYVIMYYLISLQPFYSILIVPAIFLSLSFIAFKKRILKRY